MRDPFLSRESKQAVAAQATALPNAAQNPDTGIPFHRQGDAYMAALPAMTLNRYGMLLLGGLGRPNNPARRALRQLGLNVQRFIPDGGLTISLLKKLSGQASSTRTHGTLPYMVLCPEHLGDMSWHDFLHIMRLQGLQRLFPIVMVVPASLKEEVVHAGAHAALTLPYSLNDLSAALQNAVQAVGRTDFHIPTCKPGASALQRASDSEPTLRKTSMTSAVAALKLVRGAESKVLQQPETRRLDSQTAKRAPRQENEKDTNQKSAKSMSPLLLSRHGLQLLRNDNFAEAETLLRAALEYDPMDLESCLGLMRLEKRRSNESAAARWLRCAAIICLRSGQEERAADLFERLPQSMREKNPFLEEAGALLREGSYHAASRAFIEAWARQSEESLHGIIGRACQFTDAPEAALRSLCKAYAKDGRNDIAANLASRLSRDPWHSYDSPGIFSAFPLLHDVVEVVKFTLRAWKNAAV